jgi:hypothetical protein
MGGCGNFHQGGKFLAEGLRGLRRLRAEKLRAEKVKVKESNEERHPRVCKGEDSPLLMRERS